MKMLILMLFCLSQASFAVAQSVGVIGNNFDPARREVFDFDYAQADQLLASNRDFVLPLAEPIGKAYYVQIPRSTVFKIAEVISKRSITQNVAFLTLVNCKGYENVRTLDANILSISVYATDRNLFVKLEGCRLTLRTDHTYLNWFNNYFANPDLTADTVYIPNQIQH